MEVYNIYLNGELMHDKIGKDAMFSLMEDYAKDYYLNPDKEGVIDPKNLKKQKDNKSIAFQRAGSVSGIGQENEALQPAGFFRGAQSHLHLFLENLHLFLGNSNLGDNASGHLA